METAKTFLNSKIGALLLLALAFGLIYNPVTKFPYTFCVVIAAVFIFTFLQDGHLKELSFKKLTLKDIGVIILCFAVLESTMDFIIQPLVTKLCNEPADYSDFEMLKGKPSLYFKYLWYVWLSAAFGEEILFRAFAFAQLEKIIGKQKIVIVFLSAVLFSLPHLYQGTSGLIVTFIFGLAFGVIYQSFKNIWISIIVHGLIDTLFLTLAYYGMLSFYN